MHNFRLEIKKAKSLLSLFAYASENNKLLKKFKPVKKVFKHAGVIRDAFIHLQLINQYQIKQPELKTEQQTIIKKETEELCRRKKKNLKRIRSSLQQLKRGLRNIKKNVILNYYASQLDCIVFTLAKRDFSPELHVCRKRIKSLLYNKKIAFKASGGELKLNTTYLDKLQEMIGQWHDTSKAKELFCEKGLQGQPVIAELNQQIRKLEKSIILISDNFWQKATVLADQKAEIKKINRCFKIS